MKRCALAGVLLLASAATFADDRPIDDRPIVIVVVGAEGTEEYGRQVREWAGRWAEAAQQGRAELTTLGLEAGGGDTDRDLLQKRLADRAEDDTRPLWLVLIGHGTFDGKTTKFNLRGPQERHRRGHCHQ